MKRKTKLFILLTVIILLIVITFFILFKVFIGYSNNHTGDRDGQLDVFIIDDGSGGDTPKPEDKKPVGPIRSVIDQIIDWFTGGDDEENSAEQEEPVNDDPEPLNVVIEPVVDTDSIDGELVEADPEMIWDSTNLIHVFKNQQFNNSNLIAPGSYGAYHFQVQNKTTFPVVYNLEFEEDNFINVNMLYRLRKNDKWIVKQWTKLPDIFLETYRIESTEVDDYVLEWKWFDADNDSELGRASSFSPLEYRMLLRISGYGDYEEEENNTETNTETNTNNNTDNTEDPENSG